MKTFSAIIRFIPLLLLMPIISCRTPLKEPQLADLQLRPSPKALLEEFHRTWPKKLTLEQAAVIKMGYREITSLGLCSFNSKTRELALALMTTTGMKIIEVTKKKGITETRFAIPEFSKNKKAPGQLIQDVENIYFMPEKRPDYCEIRRNMVIFRWYDKNTQQGTELIFGKNSTSGKIRIAAKKIYHNTELTSVVYYYSYQDKEDKAIPMSIGYENLKFNYTLKLNTKQVIE